MVASIGKEKDGVAVNVAKKGRSSIKSYMCAEREETRSKKWEEGKMG